MKIVLIEDEKLTADDLATTIIRVQPETEIEAILHSVKDSVNYFKTCQSEPDLIFSDIQLGDGTCFDIFSHVNINVPVIFCTAFDEYALNAFKANGIDYILKPFTDEIIELALRKYNLLKETMTGQVQSFEKLLKVFTDQKHGGQEAILVYYKDKILPVAMTDIAFFFLKNSTTQLTTFEKNTYTLNKTLDDLEMIVGASFFRVNRQYLVSRKGIIDASSNLTRKLSLSLKVPAEDIVLVSREKITQFLHWLTIK